LILLFVLRKIYNYFYGKPFVYKTMIILGSGGHTSEMFRFLNTLSGDLNIFEPRHYIVAKTDVGPNSSEVKAIDFEKEHCGKSYDFNRIPRSREVKQSYFTSVFTTLYSFMCSLVVVLRVRPHLILANGPGTCLPVCICGWLLRLLGILPYCKIVLLESYACVYHPSLTVRMLHFFVDMLCVQWTYLLDMYPNAIYTGLLPLNDDEDKYLELNGEKEGNNFAFVTVGSTKFEDLIKSVDNKEVVKKLQQLGFCALHIQKGNGDYIPKNIIDIPGFDTVIYDYKPSIMDEIKNCALVIGHAGTGTIFDTLQARRNLLVVPNTSLHNNHQIEIARELGDKNYLYVTDCDHLIEGIDKIKMNKLKLFPTEENFHFKVALYSLLEIDNDHYIGGDLKITKKLSST